jgi:lipopolysaccharide/colanic/teichoic acid biosynthesis glycosyltransferase
MLGPPDGSDSAAVGMSTTKERCESRFRLAAKRSLDLIFGVFALVFLSPILLVIAGSVWLCEGRPVIYRQTRVRRGGRAFTMYKFRSMVTDAHERLDEVRSENQRSGPLFKAQSDPRSTRLGRFLRATSLDELPQLYNVVNGSMSLVGPRPALFEEREHFPAELLEREAFRPGLTGLWQVQARHDPEFDRYRELDLLYVRAYTFRRDLGILLRTPIVVVRDAWRGLARTEPFAERRAGELEHGSAGYAEGLRQSRTELRASRHYERRAAISGGFVVGAGVVGAAVVAAAAFAVLVFASVLTVSPDVGGGHRAATLAQQPPSSTTPPSSPGDALDPPSQTDTPGALSSGTASQAGRSPLPSSPLPFSLLPSSNSVATPPTTAGAQVPAQPPSNSSGLEQPSSGSSPPPNGAPAPATPTTSAPNTNPAGHAPPGRQERALPRQPSAE